MDTKMPKINKDNVRKNAALRQKIKRKNKGTGAGGAKTNLNGGSLEKRTRGVFSEHMEVIETFSYNGNRKYKVQMVKIVEKELVRAPETAFKQWDIHQKFSKDSVDYKNKSLHGAKCPDDAFVDSNNKIIYWIECKVQEVAGSKCEVLQTYNQKIRNLKKRYPEYEIKYIYILDKNFRKHCPLEIEYMIDDGITVVWNDDENFEKKLLNIIR